MRDEERVKNESIDTTNIRRNTLVAMEIVHRAQSISIPATQEER